MIQVNLETHRDALGDRWAGLQFESVQTVYGNFIYKSYKSFAGLETREKSRVLIAYYMLTTTNCYLASVSRL